MNTAEIIAIQPPPRPPAQRPPHAATFEFESDFVASLRCIPMAVRFKLDRCGIKLTLRQWSRFTLDDRERLLLRACETALEVAIYNAVLAELVIVRAGEEAKPLPPLAETPWEDAGQVAPIVVGYARSIGLEPPSNAEWAGLTELQRFVLIKLTRDNHDNVNFVPALQEFGLGR